MGMKEVLEVQTALISSLRGFLVSRGFVEILPVVVAPATDPLAPDPASSVEGPVSFEYLGRRMYLTQSMILHKMLAVSLYAPRIFSFSPNVRLERRRSGRHLVEFVQLDFEAARATMDDIMALVEDMVVHALDGVKRGAREALGKLGAWPETPKRPFPRIELADAVEEFGQDWELRLSSGYEEPIWVTNIKREFYDREDPPGRFRNYDLIWPRGHGEALSGGEREWRPERILRRMDDGVREVVAPFLELASKGVLVPSAGAGMGLERLLKFVLDAESVYQVRTFPRIPGVVPAI